MRAVVYAVVTGIWTACGSPAADTGLQLIAEGDSLYRISGLLHSEAVVGSSIDVIPAFSVTGFGHIADIAGFDGGFGVLDRMEKKVVLYDAAGTRLGEFGRAGRGPGEMVDPVAMTWNGNEWVVLDLGVRVFQIFDSAGVPVRAVRAEPQGDWAPNITRWGVLRWDHPYQAPDENLADNLVAVSGVFIHLLSDVLPPGSAGQPMAKLWQYDPAGPTELVMSVPGVSVRRRTPDARIVGDRYTTPLLTGRPLVAAGNGWLAVMHGDSSTITIVRASREHAVVRFQNSRGPVTDENRRALARTVLRFQAEATNAAGRMAPAEVERAIEQQIGLFMDLVPFASHLPNVAAMQGGGDCLWLNLPAPAASIYFGQSPHWIGLDVRRGRFVGVIRVPDKQIHVRAFDATRLYATWSTGRPEPTVVVYNLPPAMDC